MFHKIALYTLMYVRMCQYTACLKFAQQRIWGSKNPCSLFTSRFLNPPFCIHWCNVHTNNQAYMCHIIYKTYTKWKRLPFHCITHLWQWTTVLHVLHIYKGVEDMCWFTLPIKSGIASPIIDLTSSDYITDSIPLIPFVSLWFGSQSTQGQKCNKGLIYIAS